MLKDIGHQLTTDVNFRKTIWVKFVKGIKEFKMINKGDKIAVCISGGKDSMLLAKCIQELQKHSDEDFEAEYICMDPGYSSKNRQKIIENAKLLEIPLTMFETRIFEAVDKIDDRACYLCARMRRGYLYRKAKEMGCNKIALGHHFDDVIETILMGMFYGTQFQTMMPKLHSTNFEGMELIRPLYFVKEADIIKWRDKNGLVFINCACKITEKNHFADEITKKNRLANEEAGSRNCTKEIKTEFGSKREEMKRLLKQLRETNKDVDMNIYNSTKKVNLDTIISYMKDGEEISFLDNY